MILRACFAVPEALGFTVDQVRAAGEPIAFGGQIVDHIQMTLTGMAKDRGTGPGQAQACLTKCCEHPQRAGIEAVVDRGDDCAAFPWNVLDPVVEAEAVEPGVAPPGVGGEPDEAAQIADLGTPAYSRLGATR